MYDILMAFVLGYTAMINGNLKLKVLDMHTCFGTWRKKLFYRWGLIK
jgi:hypothetical protein